jgi:hypothetical protein
MTGTEKMTPLSTNIPNPEIEVLSQEIGDDRGFYRIRHHDRVRYVTIAAGVYDDDTMCRPYLLIPALPEFPPTDWTTMEISRAADGSLTSTIGDDPLPTVQKTFHPNRVDILSLKRLKYHRARVHEVLFNGHPAITKIACWWWEIPRMENETRAYAVISKHASWDPPLAPTVLGHLTENGRVMGLLLEKVDGRFASPADLPQCEEAVRRLHGMGLIHGDVNRYNFLIEAGTGTVRMVDFEHVQDFSEEDADEELHALPFELAEDTGRGWSEPMLLST